MPMANARKINVQTFFGRLNLNGSRKGNFGNLNFEVLIDP